MNSLYTNSDPLVFRLVGRPPVPYLVFDLAALGRYRAILNPGGDENSPEDQIKEALLLDVELCARYCIDAWRNDYVTGPNRKSFRAVELCRDKLIAAHDRLKAQFPELAGRFNEILPWLEAEIRRVA